LINESFSEMREWKVPNIVTEAGTLECSLESFEFDLTHILKIAVRVGADAFEGL
jgi:hypothetical protein